jgi:hypothetical protein
VTVGAHALPAFVLVDLSLTALFERSHVRVSRLFLVMSGLMDDFVQRVLDDAFGTQ